LGHPVHFFHSVTIALLVTLDSFTLGYVIIVMIVVSFFFQLIKSASEYCSSYAMRHVANTSIYVAKTQESI